VNLGQHGFVPESAWLLHCKKLFGLAAASTVLKRESVPARAAARFPGYVI
jgi:hypothetical protein